MKTLRQACVPRSATFDPARRDTVLDLSDLVGDRIDPASFFVENHVTEGMRTLLTEGFRRLEGRSTQGVFKAGYVRFATGQQFLDWIADSRESYVGGAVTATASVAARSGSMGFGFQPGESEHHFVVTVAPGNREDVTVAEHLRVDSEAGHAPPSLGSGPDDAKLRAALPRAKWNAIADEVRPRPPGRTRPRAAVDRRDVRYALARVLGRQFIDIHGERCDAICGFSMLDGNGRWSDQDGATRTDLEQREFRRRVHA